MKENKIVACGMTQVEWDEVQHQVERVILRQQQVSDQKRSAKNKSVSHAIKTTV